MTIGPNCVIGHNVILHGCTIGANSLIGMGADFAATTCASAENSLVGAGALVTEGKTFPDGSLIVGSPARAIRALDDKAIKMIAPAGIADVRRYKQFRAGFEAGRVTADLPAPLL